MVCKPENTVLKYCVMPNKYMMSSQKNSLDIKVMFPIQSLACHLTLQVGSQRNAFTIGL